MIYSWYKLDCPNFAWIVRTTFERILLATIHILCINNVERVLDYNHWTENCLKTKLNRNFHTVLGNLEQSTKFHICESERRMAQLLTLGYETMIQNSKHWFVQLKCDSELFSNNQPISKYSCIMYSQRNCHVALLCLVLTFYIYLFLHFKWLKSCKADSCGDKIHRWTHI